MREDTQPINSGEEALRRTAQHAINMAMIDEECERGYAQLGWLLLEVASMQYWRVRYESWRLYLKGVAAVSKKTVAQLVQYFLTVRDLSDTFGLGQLEAMGISKAMKLRQAKDYAIVLPAVIVNAALDPKVTVKELKRIISETLKMPEEEGDWMDLEFEFMVTPEERATFEAAMDSAIHEDPVIKSTISKSAQMKEVALRWAIEFLNTYPGVQK